MILAQQIVWATSLTFTKTSILTLYSKVFTVSYFIIAAKVTAVIIFLWFVPFRHTLNCAKSQSN